MANAPNHTPSQKKSWYKQGSTWLLFVLALILLWLIVLLITGSSWPFNKSSQRFVRKKDVPSKIIKDTTTYHKKAPMSTPQPPSALSVKTDSTNYYKGRYIIARSDMDDLQHKMDYGIAQRDSIISVLTKRDSTLQASFDSLKKVKSSVQRSSGHRRTTYPAYPNRPKY